MMLDALLEYGDRSRVFRDKLKRFLGDSNPSGGPLGGEVPPIEQIAAESFGVQLREGAEFGGETPSQEFSRVCENSWLKLEKSRHQNHRKGGGRADLYRQSDLEVSREGDGSTKTPPLAVSSTGQQ